MCIFVCPVSRRRSKRCYERSLGFTITHLSHNVASQAHIWNKQQSWTKSFFKMSSLIYNLKLFQSEKIQSKWFNSEWFLSSSHICLFFLPFLRSILLPMLLLKILSIVDIRHIVSPLFSNSIFEVAMLLLSHFRVFKTSFKVPLGTLATSQWTSIGIVKTA